MNNVTNKKKQKGGKVITSGGFGCIFNPVLKCDKQTKRDSGKISKLMLKKHANEEFSTIQNFKAVLQVVPKYNDYYLLDNFTLCNPNKLTNEDLKSFNKKCKALTKKNYTRQNVNNNLNELMIINMPNGGVDVEKFIKTEDDDAVNNIVLLNNSLINLLVNGIIPMNKLNIYHCDIKDGNILVQNTEQGLKPRLIDWGLSVYHQNPSGLPRKLYRRPFQYNVPFSVVLFNKEFTKYYSEFLLVHAVPDYYMIREFVINYIFIWNDIRGSGHLNTINNIVKKLTIKELSYIQDETIKSHIIEYDFTYYYIVEYLSKILEKYTINGRFELIQYFNSVFLKIIDVWGFIMSYIPLYEILSEDFNKLTVEQMLFINKIKYIIIHFLYENPLSTVNIDNLVIELTSLNDLAQQFKISNTKSSKLNYLNLLSEVGGKIKKDNKDKKLVNKTRKSKTKSS